MQTSLEEFVAKLNGLAFWKEFTFARNKFAPKPGRELELADSLVLLGRFAIVMQLKQRDEPTSDPTIEANWFRNKVLSKGVSQIADSMRYLAEHECISVTNERGDDFQIRGSDLDEVIKVIVFAPSPDLPKQMSFKKYHLSRRVGLVHLISAIDYSGIVETLRVPEDIRRYFTFRAEALPLLVDHNVLEVDLMGAFLGEENLPNSRSRHNLARFIQDLDAFDLSSLIGDIHAHIEQSDRPRDYYRIMLEFAKLPRSMWREIKARLLLSLRTAKAREFTRPYLIGFPNSDCAFMIAPYHPDIKATGPEGVINRVNGLRTLTYTAMYTLKMPVGVGIQVSMDGDFYQIDWCLLDIPWRYDPEMEGRLEETPIFRTAREKMVDSFFLTNERE